MDDGSTFYCGICKQEFARVQVESRPGRRWVHIGIVFGGGEVEHYVNRIERHDD